jgi:hypothetical protein
VTDEDKPEFSYPRSSGSDSLASGEFDCGESEGGFTSVLARMARTLSASS